MQIEILYNNYLEFKLEASSFNGAILFCVARGKFSEGENFKGDLCRGVIIMGIPNLNLKSPK